MEDARYVSRVVKLNDGKTPHRLTVRDVPVDGFWPVTIYNAKGFYEEPEKAISANNVTGKRNADGSMPIRFGGDPAAENCLRTKPHWNYTVRLYRPRDETARPGVKRTPKQGDERNEIDKSGLAGGFPCWNPVIGLRPAAARAGMFKNIPRGWKARAKELDKDLIEKPEGGVATIMTDEFSNDYDKTGPGMSNDKP